MSKEFSRRDFLNFAAFGAAGVAAGGMLSACSPQNDDGAQRPTDSAAAAGSDARIAWDTEADIVVVGGGGTGYSAAVTAAEEGASVLVLEKNSVAGGDASLCAGILAGGGSRAQKELSIASDADMVYEWFMAHPEWYGPKDPVVCRAIADGCAPTLDWLEDLGVSYYHVGPYYAYTELPVIHIVDGGGGAMMQVLMDKAEELGVETLLEHRAVRIIGDESGRAIGVEATDARGNAKSFRANKAVIMACGDYTGSTPMLGLLGYEYRYIVAGSMPTLEGDGIAMAQKFGVMTTRTSSFPHLSTLAGATTGTMVNVAYSENQTLQGIWLDQEGKRFTDEGLPYYNPFGHRAVVRKQNEQEGVPPVMFIGTTPQLEDLIAERGEFNWPTGSTVEEVAQQVGIDPAGAKAAVEAYNAQVAAGTPDPFGRSPETMTELVAPFYAASMMASTSTGMGGMKIDGDGHALRLLECVDGVASTEVVPGLYAGGCVCEWNTAQGCSAFAGMVMGRIAARNALKEA